MSALLLVSLLRRSLSMLNALLFALAESSQPFLTGLWVEIDFFGFGDLAALNRGAHNGKIEEKRS
jgi:hypothetical protein